MPKFSDNIDVERTYEDQTYELYRKAAALAGSIETCMYKKFRNLSKDYSTKARSLLFNLKDEKNPELRLKMLSGELEPKELVDMDSKALASALKQSEREDLKNENLAARRTDWATENAKNDNTEGFFKCHKCGSKKTTYTQL